MLRRELPEGWDRHLPEFPADPKGLATRESSGQVLNAVAGNVPWLIGGSADLGPSTKTRLTADGAGDLQRDTPGGRNLHFGIREQAMGAIVNGLALSKVRAFGSGFFISRLHARADSPECADGDSQHLISPTPIGVGERRSHPPADRAARVPARHPDSRRPADANEVVEARRVITEPKRELPCLC
jgi:transketolase